MSGNTGNSSALQNLSDDYREYLSLNHFITLNKTLDERTMIEQCRVFCLQSEIESVRRTGMEFLYMNGFYDDLEQLILKNSKSVSKVDREWAEVYQLMLASKESILSLHQLKEQSYKIDTTIPELKCLLHFIKVNIDYMAYQYDSLGYYLDEIKELIYEIECPVLSSLYETRLNAVLFTYFWKRNQLILARKHAYKAINNTISIERKAKVHINLGLTYIYDDFASSAYHLNEALKITEKFNMPQLTTSIIEKNYPFVCAHFGKIGKLQTNDPSEMAHIEIAKGNLKAATDILTTIPTTPFRKYYLGLATGSENLLLESCNEFIEQRSDFFFAKLPIIAMEK
ncbi:AimR family lysis-lysogeny pheromone receptor [Aquibacillus saliphilus]|uniref:AimR family lysis-lysogeny pheromone receptor n=1 Tax=Aquibacillus saliphilus TaxID=1909422 RepID=UPI001CEFDD4D|nr:AimR family lysis-lysogeny pheromone receptor [Aquibacillus saliphilus]